MSRPALPQFRAPARDAVALGYLLLVAALGTALGLASGNPVLLLVLTALPPYLVFLDRVRSGRRAAAIWLMVGWAAFQATAVVLLTVALPDRAAEALVNGPHYRDIMFRWIRTGVGSEGDWRQFLPEHALHYAVFLVLSALTAGAGGIVLGTLLLNYMSFYVGSLFLADSGGGHTLRLILMGWPIWSIIRVIGFIAGAVGMADLTLALLARRRGHPHPWPGPSSYALSLSLALVILDALIKSLLAGSWRLALLPIVGPGAP